MSIDPQSFLNISYLPRTGGPPEEEEFTEINGELSKNPVR
jgi:hypothetical protein